MIKCRIEDCVNEANVPGSARGLCRAHYRRWQNYGDENIEPKKVYSWKGLVCAQSGCTRQAAVHGMCENHYAVTQRKARRRNDPEGQRRRNLAFKERYRAKQEELMGRPRPDRCEVCNESGQGRGNKPNSSICFDHDHLTGTPRGWLCDRCNKVLGMVGDRIHLLHALASYLQHHAPPLEERA